MALQRVAMWSGPRNISTALMRSFGSRPDTEVVDEPFYARYLRETGIPHPGREEVIARHETGYARIVETLTGPVAPGVRIFYQKQMAHHILPGDDLSWTERPDVANCFLIRDPAEVITSFIKVTKLERAEQLGLPQQLDLFERTRRRTGRAPPVVDARDVLEDPRAVLGALCGRLGVAFDDRMLRWEPGPRATDGVWGPWWYDAVYRSTGFAPYAPKDEPVPRELRGVLAECRAIYDQLRRWALSGS